MKEQNYATLPACQKLVEKGIVIKTEAVWCFEAEVFYYREPQWRLYYRYDEPMLIGIK